jgi:3-mercaptopyruvate sulfurtransferase SseA
MLTIVALMAVTMSLGWSTSLKATETGAKAEWKFHDIVPLNFVQQHVKIPKTDNVMIIDSRPYKPKYVKGHIPTAVSIPHSKFDQSKGKLPKDKNALLIFYCGGLK